MINSSMWQEESAVVPTFYITFCSLKVVTLQQQQAPEVATSESNKGHIYKWSPGKNIAGNTLT